MLRAIQTAKGSRLVVGLGSVINVVGKGTWSGHKTLFLFFGLTSVF